jgi:hypothetical protein
MNGQPEGTHSRNAEKLKGLCARTDQTSAALLKDLKQRGLLVSTIVIWTGKFGRHPISQGYALGSTDSFGYAYVESIINLQDLHASLLASRGLEHTRLTRLPQKCRNPLRRENYLPCF